MTIINYYKEPPSLAWDVAAAIFGTDGVGGLYDPSALDTLFQDVNGTTPAVPGSPVGLVLDRSGNGINLSQPTTAARPILARMPKTGRRNIIPSSDTTHPSWVKQDTTLIANAGPAPDGTMSATRFSTTNRMYFNPNPGITYTQPLVLTFYAKADAGSSLSVSLASISPTGTFTLDLNTGIVTGNSAATITPDEDGWYKVIYKAAASSATGYFQFTNAPASIFLWGFQWEFGTVSTPFQHVRNAFDVTEAGVPDTYSLVYDLADDNLTTTLPQAINGDILIAGTKGSIIEPVSYAAGSTFTLGPTTYTGGTPGIMRALGDIVGVVLIDRTLTQTERDNLIQYYKGRGAKGLLVPGPELVVNGDFSDGATGWTVAGTGWTFEGAKAIRDGLPNTDRIDQIGPNNANGRFFLFDMDFKMLATPHANARIGGNLGGTGQNLLIVSQANLTVGQVGKITDVVAPTVIGGTGQMVIRIANQLNYQMNYEVDNVSLRELRPQEDW